nr:type VII secretion protein EccB [Gordonia araii]
MTTRQQVNGYRFLLRRLEHALIRRDVRMLHDPMRAHTRSLSVGIILAVLITAGCGVYGLIRPAGSVGKSKIIVSKESGGLYVVIGNRIHPVLNVASARLIAGSAEKPSSVKESKLSDYDRGPLIGIPGAPQTLPVAEDPANWTVCDTVNVPSGQGMRSGGVRTAVIVGPGDEESAMSPLKGRDAVLVSVGDTEYLVYDGKRAVIKEDDSAVRRALNLDQVTPRPISAGLLKSIPEVPELETPEIDRSKRGVLGMKAGSIARVTGLPGEPDTLYAVLPGGLQRISPLVAEVLRYADTKGESEVKTVSAAEAAAQPLVSTLAVGHFPTSTPDVVTPSAAPVTCFTWFRPSSASPARVGVLVGMSLPVPSGREPTDLVTADGPGPNLDQSYIPPASGYYVRMTGTGESSRRAESLVYVADTGTRYGVPDPKTGQVLGLGESPQLAPWPIVSLLVPGPTLAQENALVIRDTMKQVGGGQTVAPPSK